MYLGKGLPGLFLLFLFSAQPASAQLLLISSTPADGAVGVALSSEMVLVFNSVLDTSAWPGGTGGFVAYELFSQNSTGIAGAPKPGADGRSVTISLQNLAEESYYIFVLWQARGLNVKKLPRPQINLPGGTATATLMSGQPCSDPRLPYPSRAAS